MVSSSLLTSSSNELKETPPSRNPAPAEPSTRGDNWVHPSLTTRYFPGCGRGVIATDDITKGTLLIVYGGRVLTTEELMQLPEELSHYPYQIDDDLFLGPTSLESIGLGEMINHSCDPTCGFISEIRLAAITDIKKGSQLTMDYATCVCSEMDVFSMQCACGSPKCRGWVTGEDWQLTHLQEALFPFFQPFLQGKILAKTSSSVPDHHYHGSLLGRSVGNEVRPKGLLGSIERDITENQGS